MMEVILILYFVAVGILMVYGINCHVMTHLFKRRLNRRKEEDQRLLRRFHSDLNPQELPTVTSQLPIYNEMNAAGPCLWSEVEFRPERL